MKTSLNRPIARWLRQLLLLAAATFTCAAGQFSYNLAASKPLADAKGNLPGTTVSVITLTEDATIHDLNVYVDIVHPWANDVQIFLTHRDTKTYVQLLQPVGRAGANIRQVTFDQEATYSIALFAPPFGPGSFQPNPVTFYHPKPLSAFDGESLKGTWELKIIDLYPSYAGTLVSWGLRGESTPLGSLLPFGSFETGNFEGWSYSGGHGVVWKNNGTLPYAGGSSDGQFALQMNAGNSAPNFHLSQSIKVIPGETYRVDFDYARYDPNPAANIWTGRLAAYGGTYDPNALKYFDDSRQNLNPGSYRPLTKSQFLHGYFTFKATGSSATVGFLDKSTGTVDADLMLDNIQVHRSDASGNILPEFPTAALSLTTFVANPICVNDRTSANLITTIYQDTFDASCSVVGKIQDLAAYPFAGYAGGLVWLYGRVSSCAGGYPLPIKVQWSIPAFSMTGTESWTGSEGYIHIRMPSVVGAYTVDLTFMIGTRTLKTVQRKFFVTKSYPTAKGDIGGVNAWDKWVGSAPAPRLSWYERATEWAAGIPASADDVTFMTSLVKGQYAYGQKNWRYGWVGYDWVRIGKPPCKDSFWDGGWRLLEDPLYLYCNSDICYGFSEALEKVANTLGINSLTYIQLAGWNSSAPWNGLFVTVQSPSLDPIFTGNSYHFWVGQDPGAGDYYWDRYTFMDHSLVKVGDKYFDATFGKVYSSAEEPIAFRETGETTTYDGQIWKKTREGALTREGYYGSIPPWAFYDGSYRWFGNAYVWPGPVTTSAADFEPLAALEAAGPAPSFTGQALYSLIDADGDGIADQLEAEVEVELPASGHYLVTGLLERAGRLVANRPVSKTQLGTRAELTSAIGLNTVKLLFSGEQIFRSGLDGPYTLKLVLFGEGTGNDAVAELPTPAIHHQDFGEHGASLVSVADSAADADQDGALDQVRVLVNLTVRRAGTYSVSGGLSKSGHTLISASHTGAFAAGANTVALDFSGQALASLGESGPFAGVVNLKDEQGQDLGGLQFTTADYPAGTFLPLLQIAGPWTEEALDTDENKLFNLLRLTQPVSVAEAGDYIVSAKLSNASDDGLYADARVHLARGANTVSWEFPGPLIRSEKLDGPYSLDVVVHDAATGLERDRMQLTQTTQPYKHTEFDASSELRAFSLVDGSSDQGIDLNNNGLFDQLSVEIAVIVPENDVYDWSARLEDAHGTEIAFATGQGSLDKGTGKIQFLFDGSAIGRSQIDGPYNVRGLLLLGSGQGSLTAAEVATTGAYKSTQFEGAPKPGDIDGDGDVDRDDLAVVTASRGSVAQGPRDRRDLDGDGKITALDARKLVTLFTRPGGATQ